MQHLRGIPEEAACLPHGHVQHIRNGIQTVRSRHCHFKHVGTIPAAITIRAPKIHIAQELHFNPLKPASLAGGTPPFSGIEAECPRLVAPLASQRLRGELLADCIKCPNIAGRVGACGFPDWGLVDKNNIRKLLMPGNPVMPAGAF